MPVWGFILLWCLALGLPVLFALAVRRQSMAPTAGRALLAGAFATGAAFALWRAEWFDVWRHGTPSPSQLLVYAAYVVAAAALGWWLAKAVLPSTRSSAAT